MDPAEALFKRVARLWGRLTRSEATQPPPEGAVALATESARLEALAALLTGTPMEVRPAHDGAGGVTKSALFLPRVAHIEGDPEASAELYRVRVAFSAVVLELGLHTEPGRDDPFTAASWTLLAVPTVRAHLSRTYPAAAERELSLSRAIYAARPEPEGPPTLGGALTSWARALAGASPWDALPPALRPILDETRTLRFESADAHRAAATRLVAALDEALPRRGPGPLPNPVWGTLMTAPEETPRELVDEAPAMEALGDKERRVVELDRAIHMKRVTHRRREDKPLYHMFEKAETAEEYAGESGTPDTEGDVREMEEALSELSLGQVIRTTDDPRNLVRADVIMDPSELEVRGGREPERARSHRYPEWDHKKGRYLEGHCTVVEEQLSLGDPAEGDAPTRALRPDRRHVDALRTHVMRSLYKRRARNRQLDGPEIDVEAIVERHADLVAGCTPPERLYIAPRRALRDVSILVLIDTSFSTDAWLDGRRVLDVELESLLVIAEAFGGHLEDEVAVASFRSHTRHDVRFGLLKAWGEGWDALKRVAPHVEPGGYTRIGAALRHGTALLESERARQKLLLLISDGKPTDYDRYEGRHGVEDVRKAVLEAGQREVKIFGLAVEKEAKLHLARMLGQGSYRILPRPSLLPDAMADVFTSLLSG